MPHSPKRRPLAVLMAVLVLLGHLTQVLHQAAHVHVLCAVHDRVEHAGYSGRACDEDGHGHPELPVRPKDDEREEDGHDSCPFLPPGLSDGEEPAPTLSVHLRPEAASPLAPHQPLYAEGLWLLAPKHSPPVTV